MCGTDEFFLSPFQGAVIVNYLRIKILHLKNIVASNNSQDFSKTNKQTFMHDFPK